MKKSLLFLLLFGTSLFTYSQNIIITDLSATSIDGGINVNVKTISGTGSGYLSNSYTVTGNVIDLSVCYWFDNTLPILEFDNDFPIPLTTSGNYTINVDIILSTSQVTCDNYATTDSKTIKKDYTFSTIEYEKFKKDYILFPNPTKGKMEFTGNQTNIEQIDIYNNLGVLVKHLKIIKNKNIDFNELENGIYLVKIQTKKGILNQKIVVYK